MNDPIIAKLQLRNAVMNTLRETDHAFMTFDVLQSVHKAVMDDIAKNKQQKKDATISKIRNALETGKLCCLTPSKDKICLAEAIIDGVVHGYVLAFDDLDKTQHLASLKDLDGSFIIHGSEMIPFSHTFDHEDRFRSISEEGRGIPRRYDRYPYDIMFHKGQFVNVLFNTMRFCPLRPSTIDLDDAVLPITCVISFKHPSPPPAVVEEAPKRKRKRKNK